MTLPAIMNQCVFVHDSTHTRETTQSRLLTGGHAQFADLGVEWVQLQIHGARQGEGDSVVEKCLRHIWTIQR